MPAIYSCGPRADKRESRQYYDGAVFDLSHAKAQRREEEKISHKDTKRAARAACGVGSSPQATVSNALRAVLHSAHRARRPLCVFV